MQLRPSNDVCCLFYKHVISRLYDRATYLCSVKLTFKMASYELRNGRIAARHDAHVRVRKIGKYPRVEGRVLRARTSYIGHINVI